MENRIEFKPCINYIVRFLNSILAHNRVLFKLNEQKHFSEIELSIIQESVLIKQVTAWEIFVYNIVTYCISLDTSEISNYIGLELPKKISYDNSKAIFNGINFSNFSNTNEILEIAEKLISKENNPFQQFLPPMLRYIDEAYLLRNFTAHKSHNSKAKVAKMYNENYKIDKFVRPGIFLNSKQIFELGESYVFELYYFVYIQIAVLCWRYLDLESYTKVFKENNEKEILEIGYFNMSIVFDKLSNQLNLQDETE